MNYNAFKLNNYVEYFNTMTNHQRIGQVTAVGKLDGKDIWELTLQKRYPNDEEIKIKACLNEIRPILLTKEILIKNGFQFNEKMHTFQKDGITIFRLMFKKNTTDQYARPSSRLDDKGFRVVEDIINNYSDEEEVLAKTTSVHTINALQNYFTFQLKRLIEITW